MGKIRVYIRFGFLYGLTFLLVPAAPAQQDTVRLTGESRRVAVAGLLPDSTGALTLAEIGAPSGGVFVEASLNKGPASASETFWLRFYLKNDTPYDEKWVLEFHEYWMRTDLYYRPAGDDGPAAHAQAGVLVPFDDRDFARRNKNYLPVRIESGRTVECFVRLDTDQRIPLLAPDLSFTVAPEAVVEAHEWDIRALLNIFLGIYFVMFFYNLLIYTITRDRNYLLYLFLLVNVAVSIEFNFGYSFRVFRAFDSFPYWWGPLFMVLSALLSISLILFARHFLHLRQQLPGWDRIMRYLMVALLMAPLPAFLDNVMLSFSLVTLLRLLTLAIIMIVAVRSYLNRVPSSAYFLLAQTGLLLSMLVLPLRIFGILPETEWTLFSVPIGSTLEIILFSFALADRINKLQEENERKQALLVEREKQNTLLEKQRAEKLQQADRLKDQFLANTSHELRTPLNGIIGISESLYDAAGQLSAKVLRENLGMIISSGKRLASLVNDLLDFSKIKHHDLQLQRRPLHLHALVDAVLTVNRPLVKDKNLRLINAVAADLPAVEGDENRIHQILHNLVGNAIKFTERGKVEVRAEEFTNNDLRFTIGEADPEIVNRKSKIVISVKDTGIGIPENKQEIIFREFEQADGSISREFAGTGLGLSISKQLVELHGGAMWVHSKVGEGSVFYFTLPVAAGQPLSAEAAAAPQAAPLYEKATENSEEQPIAAEAAGPEAPEQPDAAAGEERIHILVVDDEPINQQVLRNLLAPEHYRITSALNGEQALEILGLTSSGRAAGAFDLVLLDVMMPRMSGYEVCQKIREKYLSSELPIIMVTAKDQVQDLVQGLTLGANDYIVKPFTKEEFLARVNTQLDLNRIFRVTSRFIPNEFLRSLGRERITEVNLGDQTQREVTVFFSDIRSYTALAETMTPPETFAFVNAYSGRMGPLIRQHNGFVNQYLGDAIMAIFPDSPDDALRAAVAMQQLLGGYNAGRREKKRRPIQVGMGIHTGHLIMGIIGDKERMDAATIADTVNTASRIENLTKHYGVDLLISENSLSRLKNPGDFHFRYLGPVQVKGREAPIGIFECFDADPPELRAAKQRTCPDFEAGLQHFFDRNFSEAARAFQHVREELPDDPVVRNLLARTNRYMEKGAPKDWTGVEKVV